MKSRVLFVGAGRRFSMIERFKKSNFDVYCYEINDLIPASKNSRIIYGLKFSDKNFKSHLKETIKELNINLCIPFMDECIPMLSEIKNDVNSCVFLTPDKNVSELCYDKLKFEDWMTFNYPQYYPEPTNFPKIAKPRFGFSSKELHILNNDSDESKIDKTKFVIQKQILGNEFSCDAYFDKNKKFVDCVIRERIRTAGGEVVSSKTLFDEKIYESCKLIGEKMGLIGPICFQFILGNNDLKIIEINSRFGGGCILSLEAGFPIIDLIKKDYFNKKCEYQALSWKKNLLMERFFYETFFDLDK
jgi:carbamoyl-phosphate synthase large subunit